MEFLSGPFYFRLVPPYPPYVTRWLAVSSSSFWLYVVQIAPHGVSLVWFITYLYSLSYAWVFPGLALVLCKKLDSEIEHCHIPPTFLTCENYLGFSFKYFDRLKITIVLKRLSIMSVLVIWLIRFIQLLYTVVIVHVNVSLFTIVFVFFRSLPHTHQLVSSNKHSKEAGVWLY